MFAKLNSILKDRTLMNRILFTLFIIFIFKALTYIAVPLVNVSSVNQAMQGGGTFFDMLNSFSGNALSRFSVVALGISPYITASIIIQMLQMVNALPKLKELSEMGETGKQRINEITRKLALGIAFGQALLFLTALSKAAGTELIPGVEANAFVYVYMATVMTAGTALVLWLADQITRKGIGNGTSLIIMVGIISTIPAMYSDLWEVFIKTEATKDVFKFIIVCLINFGILLGVIFLQASVRKIPITNSSQGNKGEANIPIKLNTAGVIPVIFASTISSLFMFVMNSFNWSVDTFPGSLIDFLFNTQKSTGLIVYIFFITIFSFFYAFLMIAPEKVADNLEKSRSYIPGVRPGKETETFITKILYKVTLIGATYLVILAITPIIMSAVFELPSSFQVGGTSFLIIVGVAIETTKQVEATQTEKSYTGFIK